jgi:hypothetical protein
MDTCQDLAKSHYCFVQCNPNPVPFTLKIPPLSPSILIIKKSKTLAIKQGAGTQLRNEKRSQALGAQAYNPSYLGD